MYIHTLEKFEDSRGLLFPFDFSKIPFKPKRLFVITNVPKGERRGDHAHYKTEQFLLCLKGEVEVILYDGNLRSEETHISLTAMQGVYVPKLVWDAQIFKTGEDILLVLASTLYNKEDYIESYPLFQKVVK
jgi:UDP-2-acetamido-3-amino-2,3-dideoxy-glucuronate N-acetyltransferase